MTGRESSSRWILKVVVVLFLVLKESRESSETSSKFGSSKDFSEYSELTDNRIWENCPFGLKYSVECVDCLCNPKTGTTECSDEECLHIETSRRCPNGTKFTIGCGNLCHCNKATGDTTCVVVRCRKKYLKYLSLTPDVFTK